uniref:Letm1 RBD domain-containing protein n=1 Tax=Guillardia theta TaxID=55529 RepID=A0A7S4L884_GUITH|mmetsp:Transcript_39605/g.124492  ORF Transcript_39605/g.124492 Transcript_39605/m.124492 type:complete len:759 (+) Transcript_39605:189-2465(+)
MVRSKIVLCLLLFSFFSTHQVNSFVVSFRPSVFNAGQHVQNPSALQLQVLSRTPASGMATGNGGPSIDPLLKELFSSHRRHGRCSLRSAGRENVEEVNQGISLPVEESGGGGKEPGSVHSSSSAQIHEMKLPKASESQPSQISLLRKPTPRLQKLRDLLFKKDVMETLTSAEFALKLDTSGLFANTVGMEANGVRTRTTIDYDRIFRRLGACFTAIDMYGAGRISMTEAELLSLRDRLLDMQEQVARRVEAGFAESSRSNIENSNVDAQSETGRDNEGASTYISQAKEWLDSMRSFDVSSIGGVLQAAIEGRAKEVADNVRRKEEELKPVLQAFVREDGSLDFDFGTRDEVTRMGKELWARLNGVPPGEEAAARNLTALKDALLNDPVGLELEAKVVQAQDDLIIAEERRDSLYRSLQRLREGGELHEDAEKPNRNQKRKSSTRSDPKAFNEALAALISEIRDWEARVQRAEQFLALQELQLDMERICIYLTYEIEQSEEVQEQQKLAVAEFGLLDAQVVTLDQLSETVQDRNATNIYDSLGEEDSVGEEEHGGIASQETFMLDDVVRKSFIDSNELSVVANDVADLARRLGLDEILDEGLPLVPKFSFSFQDVGRKFADGARFYVEGSKLLGTDVQYAVRLIIKAALGDTLQPREVRTLRRTAKDLITFIPFIIILLIPLSPVGHVLVFSFIQRFFPDFFPTPYTDRRQNLMRIYQSVELVMPDTSSGKPSNRISSSTVRRNRGGTTTQMRRERMKR